jgi:hypothetical protein
LSAEAQGAKAEAIPIDSALRVQRMIRRPRQSAGLRLMGLRGKTAEHRQATLPELVRDAFVLDTPARQTETAATINASIADAAHIVHQICRERA